MPDTPVADYVSDPNPHSTEGGFAPGVRVYHATFGTGVVLETGHIDRKLKLVIEFDTEGQKTIVAKYVQLI